MSATALVQPRRFRLEPLNPEQSTWPCGDKDEAAEDGKSTPPAGCTVSMDSGWPEGEGDDDESDDDDGDGNGSSHVEPYVLVAA